MYTMKNGILYEDGRAVFCVGLSYYPSYHARKVPVPEDGDRVGEMKKDIRAMKEAGFNLVRAASIGDVRRTEEGIEVHTEFIEQLLDECDKVGIASMMRLQGYSMNLSGHDDFLMRDQDGREMDTTIWYDFLQNSMYHEGLLSDNDAGTRALAELYRRHPSLVSFQTYNEPHYPAHEGRIYDYHPATVAAYRKWLVKKGLMDEKQAENYEPPRERPQKDEPIGEWVNWRLFAIETLSDFLNHTADVAKEADPQIESLTCLTSAPTLVNNCKHGVSYFDNAKGMDTVGITHYLSCRGASYYHACLVLDNAESAAALQGKHCWLIEYDARTNITLQKFYQETYAAIGAGLKGIMYYQWRGDHVFPDSPEGNGFGFLNYDGTKTDLYEEKMDMVRLLNRLSDRIVHAEKIRCGAAVLYSDHAAMSADAMDNGADVTRNTYMEVYRALYRQLRAEGITADLTESDMLKANPLGFKVLFVPKYPLLSDKEKADVQAFAENGGAVYLCEDGTMSLYRLGEKFVKYEDAAHNVIDALEANGIKPVIASSDRSLTVQVIGGGGYALACLNNISTARDTISGAQLRLIGVQAKKATLYTPRGEEEIKVQGDLICLPDIYEGAFLLLE